MKVGNVVVHKEDGGVGIVTALMNNGYDCKVLFDGTVWLLPINALEVLCK